MNFFSLFTRTESRLHRYYQIHFLEKLGSHELVPSPPSRVLSLQSEIDLLCYHNNTRKAWNKLEELSDCLFRHQINYDVLEKGLIFRLFVHSLINPPENQLILPDSFKNHMCSMNQLELFETFRKRATKLNTDFNSFVFNSIPEIGNKFYDHETYIKIPNSLQNFPQHNVNMKQTLENWRQEIQDRLQYLLEEQENMDYYYLSVLPYKNAAALLIDYFCDVVAGGARSIPVQSFLSDLGKLIFDNYSIFWNEKYSSLNTYLKFNGNIDYATQPISFCPPQWPNSLRIKICTYYLNSLLLSCPVYFGRKILTYSNAFQNNKTVTLLSFSPLFISNYREHYLSSSYFKIKNNALPTTRVPNAWESIEGIPIDGVTRCLVKGQKSIQHYVTFKTRLSDKKLKPLTEALHYCNNNQWNINPKILTIMKQFLELNIEIPALGITNYPNQYDYFSGITGDLCQTPEEYVSGIKKSQWRKYLDNNKFAQKFSTWKKLVKTISAAQYFNGKFFYLPHEIDFRGRFYPIPSYFSLCDSDLYRSMLAFGTKRSLGKSGLNWLKIHLANMIGVGRICSFQERIKLVENQMENIRCSVLNPIEECWWKESKHPWQTLAACIELCNALDSPDPFSYQSGLPIYMDGCCNGLQHFAGLSRDSDEASCVNMSYDGTIRDLYNEITQEVLQICTTKALEGDSIAREAKSKINRELVKPLVMTYTYGITSVGAELQIRQSLYHQKSLDNETLKLLSTFISKLILDATSRKVQSSNKIMEWLNNVSSLYCQYNKPVFWNTPIGIPIYQPYFSASTSKVIASMGSMSVYDDILDQTLKVNSQSQIMSFPANFIHSLDATHMILTCLSCKEQGITFSSVHDSYWTHPCFVDQLNQIIRKAFCDTHSQNILENLKNDAYHQLKCKIPDPPKQGIDTLSS
ncbi:hypothetical protein MXB_4963 [Myxobolus squamalis]|nr:hypothetical protein MXB_4963 [Myxobolus squamalis]